MLAAGGSCCLLRDQCETNYPWVKITCGVEGILGAENMKRCGCHTDPTQCLPGYRVRSQPIDEDHVMRLEAEAGKGQPHRGRARLPVT